MQEIRSSLRGERTEIQERAWTLLQDLPRRLYVDAFLYRVERARELIAALREHLATDHRLPSGKQIPPSLKNEWPLILLLAGMREEGLSAWTDLLRTAGEQADPAIVHSLAIAHTAQAQRQEKEGQADAAIASWRRAIGCWAWILEKDGYWEAWAAGRARCYQVRITPQHVSDLRQQLGEYLRFITSLFGRSELGELDHLGLRLQEPAEDIGDGSRGSAEGDNAGIIRPQEHSCEWLGCGSDLACAFEIVYS